jgi:hypothetical protein
MEVTWEEAEINFSQADFEGFLRLSQTLSEKHNVKIWIIRLLQILQDIPYVPEEQLDDIRAFLWTARAVEPSKVWILQRGGKTPERIWSDIASFMYEPRFSRLTIHFPDLQPLDITAALIKPATAFLLRDHPTLFKENAEAFYWDNYISQLQQTKAQTPKFWGERLKWVAHFTLAGRREDGVADVLIWIIGNENPTSIRFELASNSFEPIADPQLETIHVEIPGGESIRIPASLVIGSAIERMLAEDPSGFVTMKRCEDYMDLLQVICSSMLLCALTA